MKTFQANASIKILHFAMGLQSVSLSVSCNFLIEIYEKIIEN